MDLFDAQLKKKNHAPLAERMRPQTLDEFVGQEHLVGAGKILRLLIEKDQLTSLILWGPPGVGKTTMASVIAAATQARFMSLSAVQAGVKEAREIIARARDELKLHGKRTILFIDEIHRFNKSQQDAFLPVVEEGTIILIGATTENPSFEVNSALLSRSRVLVLEPLTEDHMAHIITRALADANHGLGSLNLCISDSARDLLIRYANGDARTLLNILELAAVLEEKGTELTPDMIERAAQQKALRYDKAGDEHYNIISAFIKSMRNSDANAALYWLARMLDAGEDPLFVARRMVIFASEDIGNADAHAVVLATAVMQAVHMIGMPEGRINLAQAVVYCAEAPKSNRSYSGIERALEDAKTYGNLPVPLHLRNASTKLMKDLGYHKGYKYAHDYEEKRADMQCMPDELKDRDYLDKNIKST